MRYVREKGIKYVALLIVCVMMVGLLPAGGVYAVPLFEFDEITKTITGYIGPTSDGVELVIPSSINGVDVEHIGENAFENKNITSVEFQLPSNLITIGENAFFNYSASGPSINKFNQIYIPDGVTTIGPYAFIYNSLTSITMERGGVTMGEDLLIHTGNYRNNFREKYQEGGAGL